MLWCCRLSIEDCFIMVSIRNQKWIWWLGCWWCQCPNSQVASKSTYLVIIIVIGERKSGKNVHCLKGGSCNTWRMILPKMDNRVAYVVFLSLLLLNPAPLSFCSSFTYPKHNQYVIDNRTKKTTTTFLCDTPNAADCKLLSELICFLQEIPYSAKSMFFFSGRVYESHLQLRYIPQQSSLPASSGSCWKSSLQLHIKKLQTICGSRSVKDGFQVLPSAQSTQTMVASTLLSTCDG